MGKRVKLTPHYAIAFRDEFNDCDWIIRKEPSPGTPY